MLDSSIEWLTLGFAFSSDISKDKSHSQKSFHWTGDIIHLIELGYAVIESGCVNHGEVEIKAFMKFLSECFHIEIKRPSDFYYKMRSRIGSRTVFLDKMKKLLELRMDKSDERNYVK